MPVDRSSDAFRRFERALDSLKAGPGTRKAGAEASLEGPNPDTDPQYGYDQGIKMDDFVHDTGDTERELRRRSPLMPVGIALLVLAAFGGVVWFAYSDPGTSQDGIQTVELIQADPEPVKTRPENPGGLKVEHQDKLILNPDPEKPQVERLLPPPEAPLPVPTGTTTLDSDNNLDGNEETPVIVTEPQAETGSASLLAQEAEKAAKEVETAANTVIVEPSKTETEETVAAPVEAPKIPDAPAVKPKPVAKVAEASKPAAPKAPTATAATTQLAKVPTDSGYVLQLASLKSEQIALQEWKRIQNVNKGLLAQMKAIVEKAEIEGIGTRYRLQTGPFPTKATAQDLCAQLKAAKQDCLVKRR